MAERRRFQVWQYSDWRHGVGRMLDTLLGWQGVAPADFRKGRPGAWLWWLAMSWFGPGEN